MSKSIPEQADVVLIGAGIMSATLGTFLKELEPNLNIVAFERLNDCAQESSDVGSAGYLKQRYCQISAIISSCAIGLRAANMVCNNR